MTVSNLLIRSVIYSCERELAYQYQLGANKVAYNRAGRFNHLFPIELIRNIVIRNLIFRFMWKNRKLYFMLSLIARTVYRRKKVYLSVYKGSVLVWDHSSKVFHREIAPGDNVIKTGDIEICYRLSLASLTHLIKLLGFGFGVLRSRPEYNPEVLARIFDKYSLFKTSRLGDCCTALVVPDSFAPEHVGALTAVHERLYSTGSFRITKTSNRLKPPFLIDLMWCRALEQINENTRSKFISYSIVSPAEIRWPKNNKPYSDLKVGVLLNSKYNIDLLISVLSQLRFDREVEYIVRPHPATCLETIKQSINIQKTKVLYRLRVVDSSIAFSTFVKDVDIILAGNSSAAKDALDLGLPIIYESKFDEQLFDIHEWVSRGIIFDLKGKNIVALEDLKDFYSGNDNVALSENIKFINATKRNKYVKNGASYLYSIGCNQNSQG